MQDADDLGREKGRKKTGGKELPPVFLRPGARQRGAGASGSCTDCRAEVFFAQEAGERFGRFFLRGGMVVL